MPKHRLAPLIESFAEAVSNARLFTPKNAQPK